MALGNAEMISPIRVTGHAHLQAEHITAWGFKVKPWGIEGVLVLTSEKCSNCGFLSLSLGNLAKEADRGDQRCDACYLLALLQPDC